MLPTQRVQVQSLVRKLDATKSSHATAKDPTSAVKTESPMCWNYDPVQPNKYMNFFLKKWIEVSGQETEDPDPTREAEVRMTCEPREDGKRSLSFWLSNLAALHSFATAPLYIHVIWDEWCLSFSVKSNLTLHILILVMIISIYQTPLGGSDNEESTCNRGDSGLIPGLGRSPREGNGNPLQYSCLENSMDRGVSLGYNPWSRKESGTTEQRTLSFSFTNTCYVVYLESH